MKREPVNGEPVDLDNYELLTTFQGWLADCRPNLRSNNVIISFGTEGVSPLPFADLLTSYGEMVVIDVYKVPRHPQTEDKGVDESHEGEDGA